ncbi:hypothetical protein [Micrococcus sp.]|uniref:hypothetical protein n=1 Tax=Micrococcus sp. TaxID=1271 RepID=UPI002A91C024|nr:hypothetical protein [Micrococcus sp.]MDY6054968.1 hypothetical protein [Micrococcus sp.]
MTRREPPLPELIDRFADARGVPEDSEWASTAVGRFLLDDVREEIMVRELTEALAVVESTGQGPEELFGPAVEWARDRAAEASAAGEPVQDVAPTYSWRGIPGFGLIFAAALSVPVALVFGFTDGWRQAFSWDVLLVPLLLGLLMSTVVVSWQRFVERWTTVRAGAATAAVVLPLVFGLAWLLPWLSAQTAFEGSALWWVAVVAGHLGLGALGFWTLVKQSGRETAGGAAPLDDDAWASSVAGLLRSRLSYGDARAQGIADEARAHAAASGRPLAEEFGTLQDYAARFRPDRDRAMRWQGILLTAVAVYWVGKLVVELVTPGDGPGWWTVAGGVLFPLLAWWERRRGGAVTR